MSDVLEVTWSEHRQIMNCIYAWPPGASEKLARDRVVEHAAIAHPGGQDFRVVVRVLHSVESPP